MVFVLLPVTLAAIVGLAYTWILTYREVRAARAVEWPQKIALLSVTAVSVQVVLFFGMLFNLSNDQRMIGWIMGIEVLLFLVAVPCAVIRKGFARWWLAFSSIYFLAFAGFVYLVSGIQF